MLLLLLFSSPRTGPHRRASVPLLAAVLLCVVSVSASLPAGSRCPPHIDCAKEGRHFCRAGSSHCGPCLAALEEDEDGRCVVKRRYRQHGVFFVKAVDERQVGPFIEGKTTFYPDLDEEIDFIQSIIEKEQVAEVKTPKKQSMHPAAVTSRTDVTGSKTDAARLKEKSQPRLSDQTLHATTKAPLPDTPTSQPRVTGVGGRASPVAVPKNDNIIVIVISLCVVVGSVAVILATVCFVKLQNESRLAQKVDYPAFKGASAPAAPATGNGTSMGDKTLAQSAQMYHYQHQKQQMLSLGNHKPEQKTLDTEVTSDEEEVGGDFTVYECPGLAPTGEMEVKNPLFDD